MVLAANHVEVYNNEISRNITAQTAVVSYHVTRNEIKDKGYYPYPTSVYIHDNRYTRDKGKPTLKNLMGVLLFQKFGRDVPDILFDGIVDAKTLGPDGQMMPEYKLCIRNNGSARYANLDLENNAKNIQTDISVCDCDHQALEAPTLSSN
ncbi:MAG: hypothetical protein EAZ89_01805 [Bacteroidetes bacterium]|nr:MAG: hypothetical protein EAZ89_01805 [Bacteroidota bacterium]